MKKTLVLGASPNPSRYSFVAVQRLMAKGHEVVAVGVRKNATIDGLSILNGQPEIENVDTITLYLNPLRQEEYYKYILGLQPKRIIFNPGTENPTLIKMARNHHIETDIACTLVLLSTDQY